MAFIAFRAGNLKKRKNFMEKIRIQKYFSDCGVLSRRAAEAELKAGNVTVNGRPAHLGDKVDPASDVVAWKGQRLVFTRGDKKYIALYKPRGFVCTLADEKGRRQVTELVAEAGSRVYPVGRLDMASEGLLLLTDDGEFANMMTHPRNHVPKVYHVRVRGEITDKVLDLLSSPLTIDGKKIRPVKVDVLEFYPDGATLEMTLYEGRNRQIRKRCDIARIDVVRLKRTAIGDLTLHGLKCGQWRYLDPQEVINLKRAVK